MAGIGYGPIDRLLTRPETARAVYAGMTSAILLLVGGLLVLPLAGLLLDQRAAIAAAEAERAAQDRLARRSAPLLAEQAALAALGGLPADYLAGDSPALAAAALQGVLVQRVQAVGATLVSTRIVDPGEAGETGETDNRQVRARLDAAVTHAQLRDLLHALEGGRPRLIVTEMSIEAPGNGAGNGGGPLTLSLTVMGLRTGGGGGP